MRCPYCGNADAGVKKCSKCGATFSDQELNEELERVEAVLKDGTSDTKAYEVQAFELCEELVFRGSVRHCYKFVLRCLKLLEKAGDEEEENLNAKLENAVEKGAKGGDEKCMYLFARFCKETGRNQEGDFWMKKAAGSGSVEAQDFLDAENNPDVSPTQEGPGLIKTIFTILSAILLIVGILVKCRVFF